MTKKLSVFIFAILFASLANAQCLQKGSMNFSVGYGFGNFTKAVLESSTTATNTTFKGLGPLHGKFEYMTSENVGIGLSLNYMKAGLEYPITYTSGSSTVSGKEGIKYTTLSALIRLNYYFLNEDKIALYGGLGVGYRTASWKDYSDDPTYISGTLNVSSAFPLGLEGVVGAKFFFTEKIGAYTEVGVAKSIFQLGLCYNLGGGEGGGSSSSRRR